MRISDWSSDVCSSDLVFTSFTSGALGVQGQGTAAATPIMTHEGRAQALEAQASATGTTARRSAASSFGDFGERSTFGTNRAFGAAGGYLSDRTPGAPGATGFGLGRSEERRVGHEGATTCSSGWGSQ